MRKIIRAETYAASLKKGTTIQRKVIPRLYLNTAFAGNKNVTGLPASLSTSSLAVADISALPVP